MRYFLPFLGLVAWLSGCGSVVETSGSAASSGAGASGGGGTGGSSGIGGFGGFGGFGGSPSVPCTPPDGPSTPAPLCGPAEAPCQVLEQELLPVPPAFRNDAPALALDSICRPQILFSTAENGFKGFFAVRKAKGDWSVGQTPFDAATAGLVSNAAGAPLALSNDGAFGASLWAFTAEGWLPVADVPEEGTHLARGFARGNTGELYAGFRGPSDELFFGTYEASWSIQTLGATPTPPPVAISPEGAPHLVAWGAVNGAWELLWYAPTLSPEIALPFGFGSLQADVQRPALGVTAADAANPRGKPHVLALRTLQNFDLELVYATREGNNAWTVTPIETMPSGTTIYPLGVVTDEAGSVRLFYSRVKFLSPSAGQLVVAWPHSGSGVSSAVVTEGFSPIGATFDQDGAGRLHVASYDFHATNDIGIRYLVLGP